LEFLKFKKALGHNNDIVVSDDQLLTERNSEGNNGPVLKRNIIADTSSKPKYPKSVKHQHQPNSSKLDKQQIELKD
jgi:hypothetical protein